MDVPLLWRKASRDVTMNSVVDSAGLGGDVCPPSKVKLSLMSSHLIGDFNLQNFRPLRKYCPELAPVSWVLFSAKPFRFSSLYSRRHLVILASGN